MIKINLLDSVTDKPTGVAVAVEERVANPRMQTLLLALVVFGLLALGMCYDFVSVRAAHDEAQRELDKQERINQQMQAVNREQADLEKKTKDIQVRIDAIQKLRSSQTGPGNVLREIKQRFDSVPGLYLSSVEQKDSELTIKGESPDEAAVTRFGQSMEFSNGLFSNLSIETQRDAAKVEDRSEGGAAAPAAGAVDAPKPEVVSFTIKCTYAGPNNANKAAAPAANQTTGTANQVAKK
ncbi:MAG TPA: PilN domain-containing protein [Pyrinomonadaceae bacterium]|jgi:Tfp pilus assembly protein PilN|nr:PilN domain-containing protein [Pyrinomonadaceae bacterium]